MALAESAAAGILAAEADGRAFESQRAEGERFAQCPIERRGLCERVAALFEEATQLGMHMESVRKIGDAANHPLEDLLVDGGARAEAGDLRPQEPLSGSR